MFFHMPVKVYHEIECVARYAEMWCSLGSKAIIVTGKSSAKRNGSLQDVCDALRKQGRQFCIFDEVEENPSVETVIKAAQKGTEEQCDFVVGIGGGSPLDAAKAVALIMAHPEQGTELLYTPGEDRALPLVCVPTTCGTGSEVTPYSILTRRQLQSKGSIPHKLFADIALIDGRYLSFAPARVYKNTGVDALAHLYESYINANATPYSRMLADAGLRMWAKCKPVFSGLKQPDLMDFDNMMAASAMAGMAIAITATSVPHGLSYTLTVKDNTTHGVAVGYFQKGYLAEAEKEDREHVLDLSGFESLDSWEAFYSSVCDVPHVSEERLEECMESLLSNPAKLKNSPYEIDRAKLARIVGLK